MVQDAAANGGGCQRRRAANRRLLAAGRTLKTGQLSSSLGLGPRDPATKPHDKTRGRVGKEMGESGERLGGEGATSGMQRAGKRPFEELPLKTKGAPLAKDGHALGASWVIGLSALRMGASLVFTRTCLSPL
jgi:hypothetical protein